MHMDRMRVRCDVDDLPELGRADPRLFRHPIPKVAFDIRSHRAVEVRVVQQHFERSSRSFMLGKNEPPYFIDSYVPFHMAGAVGQTLRWPRPSALSHRIA